MLPAFSPLDTSHLLWASARLHLHPPTRLLTAVLVDSRHKMQYFGTQVRVGGNICSQRKLWTMNVMESF